MKTYYADRAKSGLKVFVTEGPAWPVLIKTSELRPIATDCIPECHEFDWGNESIGSFLLAASIMCDFLGPNRGLDHVAMFRHACIANLNKDQWRLTGGCIRTMIEQFETEGVL